MKAASRLFTTHVARCMTGNSTKALVNASRPLFGESARTVMSLTPISSSVSANFPSCLLVGNNKTYSCITNAIAHSQLTSTLTTNDDEQRRFRSNRSRRGLYNGKDIRTGNNLSFSMKHTKRTFKPNVFIKRVYSEILDEMVRFHLTTSTLRTIDKAGGLDNYLLTSQHITSGEGLKTKKRVVNMLKYRERKARQQQPDNDTGAMATD